jgi:hypothetical protein
MTVPKDAITEADRFGTKMAGNARDLSRLRAPTLHGVLGGPTPPRFSGVATIIQNCIVEGPELEFLVDLLKNSMVFLGILLIAAVLNSAVEWVEKLHYPWLIVNGLWLVENLLFVGDILWFSCKIVMTTVDQINVIFRKAGITLKIPTFRWVHKS